MSLSIFPQPCERCGQQVIIARMFGTANQRIVLDAVPVVGGDYATWTIGYDPARLTLLCKNRPARVAAPYDMPANLKARWDGSVAANHRRWYVEHAHDVTSATIIERRNRSA